MSRISSVIKNKNRVQREQRTARQDELSKLKQVSNFKASLIEKVKRVDVLLKNDDINGVVIKIPEKYIAKFNEAIYSEELSCYEIQQIEPDTFIIRFREIYE